MSLYCKCAPEVVSKAGYAVVRGVTTCNTCKLPDISEVSVVKRNGNGPSADSLGSPLESDFLATLFDMKIENYISVKFSRFIYAFSLGFYGLLSIIIFIYAVAQSSWLGGWSLLIVLGSIMLFFITAILSRLYVEFIVVIFQIARDIRTIAGKR
jgi:hypothetical protein